MSFTRGETPSLNTLLQLAMDRHDRQMHTAFPARVNAFDSTNQTLDVEPAFFEVWRSGEERKAERVPIVPDVPILYPRGNGFSLYIPPAVGEWVLIVCAKYSLDRWRRTGEAGDPGDMSRFTLDGAIAIPGIFPDDPIADGTSQSAPTAVFTIPAGKELHLGSYSLTHSFIALANSVDSVFNAIAGAASGDAVPGATSTAMTALGNTTGSAKVKSE